MKSIKKPLLTAITICFASSANADFLGAYVGGHAWDMDTDGGFSNDSTLTDFEFDKEAQGSFYLAFEHFVPLVPNIKVRNTPVETQGITTLSSQFVFGDQVFSSGSVIMTELDFSNTDYILYYEILDNNLVSIDAGLNFKDLDGSIYVADSTDVSLFTTESLSGITPMLYGGVRFGLPFSGFGIFADASFLSIEDHEISDYTVGVEYKFVDNVGFDFAVQAGYRVIKVELEDLDDIYSDLEFSGAFLGAQLHF